MIRKFLIEVLKGLEAAVPPPENCHHAITFARYGGEHDALALQVNHGGRFRCFFINDDDIERGPGWIIAAIVEIFNRPPEENTQFGVAIGQYTAERES